MVFCLLLVALVAVDYFAAEVAQGAYIQNLTRQLADKGAMLALAYPKPEALTPGIAHRMAQAVGGRITLVRSDGKVLVDSEAEAAVDGEPPHAPGTGGGPARRGRVRPAPSVRR